MIADLIKATVGKGVERCGTEDMQSGGPWLPQGAPRGGFGHTSGAGEAGALHHFLEISKLPNATPRSQPLPVPLSASETWPLVTTTAFADVTAPACA